MKAKNNKSFTRHVTRTGWDKSWQDHVRGTKWMVGGHLEKDNLSSTVNDVMTTGLVSSSAQFWKFPPTSLSIFSCRVATTANVFLAKTKEAFKFNDKDSRQLQWRVQLPSDWSAPWKDAQTMLCCETQAAERIGKILSERKDLWQLSKLMCKHECEFRLSCAYACGASNLSVNLSNHHDLRYKAERSIRTKE